jgi:hypothetical protein
MDADDKVQELLRLIDDELPESADEVVDELWYWVVKGHPKPRVTQATFDKITSKYHSMREALDVLPAPE